MWRRFYYSLSFFFSMESYKCLCRGFVASLCFFATILIPSSYYNIHTLYFSTSKSSVVTSSINNELCLSFNDCNVLATGFENGKELLESTK